MPLNPARSVETDPLWSNPVFPPARLGIRGTLFMIFLLVALFGTVGFAMYYTSEEHRLQHRFLEGEMGWSRGRVHACERSRDCRLLGTFDEQVAFEEWKEKQ